MQQPETISSVTVRNNIEAGDWILDTEEISVESSNDGKNFVPVFEKKIENNKTNYWSEIATHKFSFKSTTARYYKVTVKPVKSMPAWHSDKGKPAYIFVDEIVLD